MHTGIGYLAKIISAIEERPFEPLLTPENPLNTLLSCAAASSPNMPNGLRRQVQRLDSSLSISKKHKNKGKKGKVDKRALKKITEWWAKGSVEDGTLPPGAGKAMVSTTQAVDIINGGVKINALVSHLFWVKDADKDGDAGDIGRRRKLIKVARGSDCLCRSPNQHRFELSRSSTTSYRYHPTLGQGVQSRT